MSDLLNLDEVDNLLKRSDFEEKMKSMIEEDDEQQKSSELPRVEVYKNEEQ